MTDAPAWLSDDNVATGAAPAPSLTGNGLDSSPANETQTPGTGLDSAGTNNASTGGGSAEEDEADLPGIILTMRLANMAAAIVLLTCSILFMISLPTPAGFVLAIYASCGAILICCLETQLKFVRVIIAVNFGFLFNFFWRFLFYLLLGSVTWSYNRIFGKITAGVMVVVAVFNTYVLCRYPSYRRMREKIAEEEDKRIEARISKEVKKQAARQLTG